MLPSAVVQASHELSSLWHCCSSPIAAQKARLSSCDGSGRCHTVLGSQFCGGHPTGHIPGESTRASMYLLFITPFHNWQCYGT